MSSFEGHKASRGKQSREKTPPEMPGLLEQCGGFWKCLVDEAGCHSVVTGSALWLCHKVQPHIQAQISRERLVPAGRGRWVRRAEQHPRPLWPQAGPSPAGDPASNGGWFSLHCACNRSTKAVQFK